MRVGWKPQGREFIGPLLDCLCGFFKGDGRVSSSRDLKRLILSVDQSLQHPEVLLLFLWCLGGNIYAGSPQTGTSHGKLAWKLHGLSAAAASEVVLSRAGPGKGPQLKLAATGLYEENAGVLVELAQRLSRHKR